MYHPVLEKKNSLTLVANTCLLILLPTLQRTWVHRRLDIYMARTFMDDRRPMKGTERASKEFLEKKERWMNSGGWKTVNDSKAEKKPYKGRAIESNR